MRVPILQQGSTLLTSFQEDLTDRDAVDLQEDLLQLINTRGAKSVLMDVSSMYVIDSYQAKLISDTASMAKLLGCDVVLSGVRPKVAMTLVELGDAITGVRNVLNVEEGIALLRNQDETNILEENKQAAKEDQEK